MDLNPRFITTFLFCFILLNSNLTVSYGFTIDLIHRDSPYSPLYDPRETHHQRLAKALRSRSSHAVRSTITPNDAFSEVQSIVGQYLMKLSIGTPPLDVYAIVDTGSDLMWIQCQPCVNCYPQTNPIFDPKTSSTFKDVLCNSDQCHLLSSTSCSPETPNICDFSYGYGGGQLALGVLGSETVAFGSTTGQPASLQNVVFGCSRNTTGGFTEKEMGLVGLGLGPVSLISQIGESFGGKRFSHCLVPFQTNPDPRVTTKFIFGTGSEVSGDGVVSTPLVSLDDSTYYLVTMNGISVGSTNVPFNSSGSPKQGNMFLDTGTPPTIIPKDFYNRVEEEVKRSINLGPITDDPDLGTQLCYRSQNNVDAPILTVHLDGNADLQLTAKSTFVSPKPGVFCFAFVPTDSDGGVIGNFAQTDFLIGFDLDANVISFKPPDCAHLYS